MRELFEIILIQGADRARLWIRLYRIDIGLEKKDKQPDF